MQSLNISVLGVTRSRRGLAWHAWRLLFPRVFVFFFSQIDSALLAIALDDRDTPDLRAECRAFLTGDSGRNRWFDKHQLVRTMRMRTVNYTR